MLVLAALLLADSPVRSPAEIRTCSYSRFIGAGGVSVSMPQVARRGSPLRMLEAALDPAASPLCKLDPAQEDEGSIVRLNGSGSSDPA